MKKGISLVALVVTIIVLIILTGAVIATFMEGGIIDKAKEAVMRSDCETLKEAYMIEYNVQKIDVETGIGGEVNVVNVLKEAIKEIGMEKEFTIGDNAIIYTGENTFIKSWLASLGMGSASEEVANFAAEVVKNGFIYNNGYITGLKPSSTSNEYNIGYGTHVETYLSDLITDTQGYTIKNMIGNSKDVTEKLGTGDKIYDSEGNLVGTVIAYGDLDGDSVHGPQDLGIMLDAFQDNFSNLTKIQKEALDIDGNGELGTIDYMLMGNQITPDLLENPLENYQKHMAGQYNEIKVGEMITDLQVDLFEKLGAKYQTEVVKVSNNFSYLVLTIEGEEITLGKLKAIIENEKVKEIKVKDFVNEIYDASDNLVSSSTDMNSVIEKDLTEGQYNSVMFYYGKEEVYIEVNYK